MSRSSRRLAASAQLLAVTALILPVSAAALGEASKPLGNPIGPPKPSTGGVSHVHGSTATLDGSVNPHGEVTTYFFEWGPTVSYGHQTTPGTLAAANVGVKVSATVTGFLTGYHYRLVATNNTKTEYGKDRVYTLKPTAMKFTLAKVTGVHALGSSVTISGSLSGTAGPNHRIVLQASSYPFGAFTAVGGPIVTNAAGRFSFYVPNLRASTEYRVATLDPRPTTSAVLTVPVSVRVILHVRTSGHKGLVRLYGTVTPAEVGAKVFIEIEKKPKHERIFRSEKAEEKAEESGPKFAPVFETVVKRATRSFSRFSKVLTITRTGRYRVYVQLRRGPLVSGYSSSVLLHAGSSKRPAKKHK